MTKPIAAARIRLSFIIGLALLLAPCAALAQGDTGITVTLLGTGSPNPVLVRFGPSTLVEAGGQRLLFDVGRGASQRLRQIETPLSQIDATFITHFHSDHVVGLPDLWLTGWIWIRGNYGSRKKPMRLIGPIGTKKLAQGLRMAYEDDIRIRIADQQLPPEGIELAAEEFTSDGVVYRSGGVTVTAFEVDHGPLIKPAYGFRIDHAGRSVVISGDTRFSENLIKHATGTDLLVHEVAAAPDALRGRPEVERIIDHHTSAEECGTVFTRTKPKLAVYTHLVLLSAEKQPPLTLPELEAQTRRTYAGPLVIGADLMRFVIGDDVRVQRFNTTTQNFE